MIHGWWTASDAGIRSFGFFCINLLQKSLAASEMRSQSGDGKRSGSWQIMRAFSLRSWWWKGRLPESSMYATTPSAHMSTDESYS